MMYKKNVVSLQDGFNLTSKVEENKIIIYQTEDGQTQIDVRLENDTVWLTQAQMAELFQTDRTSIVRHINNIYKVDELNRESTCAKIAQVQIEGKREISRTIPYFNLDMIISVGYRVNSKRGIKFRQWANRVLKDYLVKGFAINERIHKEQIGELRQLVGMLGRTIQNQPLISTEETDALFEVVTDYTYALDTLDNYDYERLSIDKITKEEPFHATYDNAMEAISGLRKKFGGSALFGNEKDDSFKSSIGQIYQTFGGEELYPSVEEKAAMLLYLVTKNHSFSDGNKRIAATLFLWFLNNNGILYRPDGSKRIADNTLVALTLMIAESKTEEKDVMVKVVVNLINQRNE
jgi:prophage maintenance system killer protein